MYTLRSYRSNRAITSIEDVPVVQEDRVATDICCSVAFGCIIFSLLMCSLVAYKPTNLVAMTYPTDSAGRRCTLDNPNFNYLYFTSLTDTSKRLCVASCPTAYDKKLNCWPTPTLSCLANSNPEFYVTIYNSLPLYASVGLFCQPSDPKIRKSILYKANILYRFYFVSAYNSIALSMFITLILGGLFLVALMYMTKIVVFTTIVLGGIGCIVVALLIMVSPSPFLAVYYIITIIVCVVLCGIGIIVLYSLHKYQQNILVCIRFLYDAMNCLADCPKLILAILVAYISMVLMTILCGFEILACWSSGQLQLTPGYVYYSSTGILNKILIILCILQYAWLLSFCKYACIKSPNLVNFVISGSTIHWCFREYHSPSYALTNLCSFHIGSVIAGSFLLNLLYLLDIFYDVIRPNDKNEECSLVFMDVCCCCERVLGLARSYTMAFINLIGQPYCNASRMCELICNQSSSFYGNQSVNRSFRIAAHVFLASLATLCSFIYMNSRGTVSVLALLCAFVINLFVATYFICLVADIADCLMLCCIIETYMYSSGYCKNDALQIEEMPTLPS